MRLSVIDQQALTLMKICSLDAAHATYCHWLLNEDAVDDAVRDDSLVFWETVQARIPVLIGLLEEALQDADPEQGP